MRQHAKHYARPPFSCRSRWKACFSFPQILFIHSTADQFPDTWSFANGTHQEASQGSLTSCSKKRSSRVLSPGLLPAPSNSSLYSCRKALHEDIPKTQAQQHLRAPCVTDTPAILSSQRTEKPRVPPLLQNVQFSKVYHCFEPQEKEHQVQTPPCTDWSVWATNLARLLRRH